jgi:hypothetical protein
MFPVRLRRSQEIAETIRRDTTGHRTAVVSVDQLLLTVADVRVQVMEERLICGIHLRTLAVVAPTAVRLHRMEALAVVRHLIAEGRRSAAAGALAPREVLAADLRVAHPAEVAISVVEAAVTSVVEAAEPTAAVAEVTVVAGMAADVTEFKNLG